jgi:hypothetical protein
MLELKSEVEIRDKKLHSLDIVTTYEVYKRSGIM